MMTLTEETPFRKFVLEADNSSHGGEIFLSLAKATCLEETANGRKGAIIVDRTSDGLVPLIRTTTHYSTPVQDFGPIHRHLIERIKNCVGSDDNLQDIRFNNALVEMYDDRYTTMGHHSDQALDIKDGSSIALFSCYDGMSNTDSRGVRSLCVKHKANHDSAYKIPLHLC
jgi:hypothetical protein